MQQIYTLQQAINVAIIRNRKFKAKYDALVMLHDMFEENNIEYAISFSGNLFFTGIVGDFNDIDVAIRYDGSVNEFNKLLTKNGIKINYEKLNGEGLYFPTSLFVNCSFKGVQIEIYVDDFFVSDLRFVEIKDDLIIPLLSVEEMYVKYSILEEFCPEERRYKRILIEEYLRETGFSKKRILYEAMKSSYLNANVKGFLE